MKKIIAVAAIMATSFIVPALPAQAATFSEMARDETNCLVFPALKRACWEEARDAMSSGPAAVGAAYSDATTDAVDAVEDAASAVKWPKWGWWN